MHLEIGDELVEREVSAQSGADAIQTALTSLLLARRAAGQPLSAGALSARAVPA